MEWLCALVKVAHFLAKEVQLWFVELPFTALLVHLLPKPPTLWSDARSELGCWAPSGWRGPPAGWQERGSALWGVLMWVWQAGNSPNCPHAGGTCCHEGCTARPAWGQRAAGVSSALNSELTTHGFSAASLELHSHFGALHSTEGTLWCCVAAVFPERQPSTCLCSMEWWMPFL